MNIIVKHKSNYVIIMQQTKEERDIKNVKLVVAEKAKKIKRVERVENIVAEEDAKLEELIKRKDKITYYLVKIYAINLYIYFLYQFNI